MTALPKPLDAVPIKDRPVWMKGLVLGVPGIVFEDEASGTRLRLLDDGSLEEILPGGHPRPGSAHSTAR